ncbi:unnamed protein product [Durusdinium trenchii]|uniref:Uncharacterized protein n=1 Tax=Durusdinium trenchii TaxID=1381693 RepID=A0ABP0JX11_9DINO
MLTAIEAERSKLMAARAERLRIWKERSDLEKQLQDVDQERLLVSRQVPGRNIPEKRPDPMERPVGKGVPHETVPSVVSGMDPARWAPQSTPSTGFSAPKHWYVPQHEEAIPALGGVQDEILGGSHEDEAVFFCFVLAASHLPLDHVFTN